jgi:hypothetical protein
MAAAREDQRQKGETSQAQGTQGGETSTSKVNTATTHADNEDACDGLLSLSPPSHAQLRLLLLLTCLAVMSCRAKKVEQAMKDMPKKIEEYYRVSQATHTSHTPHSALYYTRSTTSHHPAMLTTLTSCLSSFADPTRTPLSRHTAQPHSAGRGVGGHKGKEVKIKTASCAIYRSAQPRRLRVTSHDC